MATDTPHGRIRSVHELFSVLSSRLSSRQRRFQSAAFLAGLFPLGLLTACNPVTETTRLADLDAHIHAMVVEGSSLLLATHNGLYSVGADGALSSRSTGMDLKALRFDPTGSGLLLASGHDADGRGLGLITSREGGATWTQELPGIQQSELHQIAVSSDGRTIYGLLNGLHVSTDGGQSFERRPGLPMATGDIAVSSVDPRVVFASSVTGLYVSYDGGASWRLVIRDAEVTLVSADLAGGVYAFVEGTGLLYAEDANAAFALVSVGWVDPLAEIAVDPTDPENLFAVTSAGAVVSSRDGGRTWSMFAP